MTGKLTREETQQIIDAADAVITALAGTNDEVHKDDTDKMVRLWDDLNDLYAPPEVVRVLARIALAAMDSESVAWTDEEELRDANESGSGYLFGIGHDANKFADPRRQIMLYRHAQPAPVVPDGYVMVPKEPTDEMIAAAMNCEDVLFNSDDSFCVQFGNIYEAMLAAAQQEEKQ